MEDLSRRLSVCGGAALVIDYGTNHPNGNTLQAVQKHAFKHVLEEPGKVDLTALVDFKSLRATVERTNSEWDAREARREGTTAGHCGMPRVSLLSCFC